MEVAGRVNQGVIVLEGAVKLPEGAAVRVTYDPVDSENVGKPILSDGDYRVEFPLVRSKHPRSVHLTSQRVQEMLDEEDLSAGH